MVMRLVISLGLILVTFFPITAAGRARGVRARAPEKNCCSLKALVAAGVFAGIFTGLQLISPSVGIVQKQKQQKTVDAPPAPPVISVNPLDNLLQWHLDMRQIATSDKRLDSFVSEVLPFVPASACGKPDISVWDDYCTESLRYDLVEALKFCDSTMLSLQLVHFFPFIIKYASTHDEIPSKFVPLINNFIVLAGQVYDTNEELRFCLMKLLKVPSIEKSFPLAKNYGNLLEAASELIPIEPGVYKIKK